MRKVLLMLALVLVISVAGAALAQEEDPSENACYTGGVWEGKCDWPTFEEDEWAWACGFYYAAALRNAIGFEDTPAWCKFMFELDDNDEVEEQFGLCVDRGDGYYFALIGDPNEPNNILVYTPETTRAALSIPEPCASLTPDPFPVMWIQFASEPDYKTLLEQCGVINGNHEWNVVDGLDPLPGIGGYNFLCTEYPST